jgi:hypothetical protein
MPVVLDLFDHFLDMLALCAGLALIIWLGRHRSRRGRATGIPTAAAVGMIVWLAVFGFAVYLVFG